MTPLRRRLVPTAAAAVATGLKEATIRKLAQRGKLTRHGTKGRALYDVDELAAYVLGPEPEVDAPEPGEG